MALTAQQVAFLKGTLGFFEEGLNKSQQEYLLGNVRPVFAPAGSIVHSGEAECLGVVLLQSGRLRAYMLSPDGREITLYFIGHSSLSMLAASCILKNVALPVHLSAEEDSHLFIIPPKVYNKLRAENKAVENYTSEVLGSTFAHTMQAIEHTVFLTLEQRLALLLLEQASFEESSTLHLTQEALARHLGTAREVVSRLLKTLSEEGILKIFRGGVTILNKNALAMLVPGL